MTATEAHVTYAGRALAFKVQLSHLWDQSILARKMRGRRGSKIVTQDPRCPHLQEDGLTGWEPKGRPAYTMAHANSAFLKHGGSQRFFSHLHRFVSSLLWCELVALIVTPLPIPARTSSSPTLDSHHNHTPPGTLSEKSQPQTASRKSSSSPLS